MNPDEIIEKLGLKAHPEGGYYREVYRSQEIISGKALPKRFGGDRAFATSIYYLLKKGQRSKLHRLKSDELWHFYSGAALTMYIIEPGGKYVEKKLGPGLFRGWAYQAVAPAGSWFGAKITGPGEYSLAGCTMAPGFDFDDFELAGSSRLIRDYPHLKGIIGELT